jgi:benzoyl-CoA reductase/2-hydroxyglutaryl-CoA dehydratase subunit BcrC/BadD/HgdB
MSRFRDHLNDFSELSRTYPGKIRKGKREGRKIVCYYGSRIPIEIINASGALHYPLFDGGDSGPAEAALPYLLPFINTQALYQVGQHIAGLNPITGMSDLIIIDCKECDSVRVGDVFEFLEMPVWKLGVPQDWKKEYAFNYYKLQLNNLKSKLEGLTGTLITDEDLEASIHSYNRIRFLLDKIGSLRKDLSPVISGEDFIKLNHFSLRSSPDDAIRNLERIYQDLKTEKRPFSEKLPRIMVAGRGFAFGDYTVLRVIEESGASIVTELLDEAVLQPINAPLDGNPMESIAHLYYRKMIPPCLFTPSWAERWKQVDKQIDEYNVNGLLYYMLSFDVIFDYEFPIFSKKSDEKGIPFEMIESSYDFSREATETLRTRIESFVGILGGNE